MAKDYCLVIEHDKIGRSLTSKGGDVDMVEPLGHGKIFKVLSPTLGLTLAPLGIVC
uniref:Uncharacterized protein n=1 Tax=Kalanchoe fedtschenkoi TaxID=63787 RepID=A0A7N0U657_KALFE